MRRFDLVLMAVCLVTLLTTAPAVTAGVVTRDDPPDPGEPCLLNAQFLPLVTPPSVCDAISRIVTDPVSGQRSVEICFASETLWLGAACIYDCAITSPFQQRRIEG